MISPQTAFFQNSRYRPSVRGVVRILQALSIFLIFAFSGRLKAQVLQTNLNTLSETVVQAAVNLASPGEEIQLPAGTGVWTTPLIINNNISLVGAGSGNTVIVDDIPSANYNYLIGWNTISNYTQCELAGITITDSSSNSGRPDFIAEVHFFGFCPVCHVTGCVFQNLYDPGIEFDQGTYGCLDHCQFPTTNFCNDILCYNGALGGFEPYQEDGENEYGDISYATPVTYGTTNWWIYIEYCGFSYNGPNYWSDVNDARQGTRVVFRYNCITNMGFQFHGTESSGRDRGGRACEIYDNFFIDNAVGYSNQLDALGFRSGTGVVYSNILVGYGAVIDFDQFRATEAFAPFGGGNGLDPWDSNGGLVATGTYTGPNGQGWLTDSSVNWKIGQWVGGWPGSGNTNWAFEVVDVAQGGTNYNENQNLVNFLLIASNGVQDVYATPNHLGGQISWNHGDTYAIYKCYAQLDQPGRGLSDLLADNGPNTGEPIDLVTGRTNWPNQALEPWYQWNNTNDGVSAEFNTSIGYSPGGFYYPIVIDGRDYYDNTVKPGYAQLPFPHPLDTAVSITHSPGGYVLTVSDGSGGGTYTNGAVVNISADAPGTVTNAAFAYWSGPDIASTNSASTIVTMPASNLTVTANYVPLPPSINTAVPAP